MPNTDVTKMAFMAVTDLTLITIDPETVGAEGTRRALEVHKANDAKKAEATDLRKEYNQLRQQLFNLQQNAKSFEIRTNEAAGKIRNLEQRIDAVLKLKKECSEAGNLRGERTYEHQTASLETELADAKEEFYNNKNWSTQAARALRSFDGERLAELKALLDAPLPVK